MKYKEPLLSQIARFPMAAILVAMMAVLPLLNVPPLFSPPDWGKTLAFRALWIVLGVWLLFKWLFSSRSDDAPEGLAPRKRFFRLPSAMALAGFLLVYVAATFSSVNPAFSFWGSPYRSGGLLNFSLYALLAFAAPLTLRKKDWRIVWHASFGAAFLVGLIAIFQQMHAFSFIFVPSPSRPASTVGGPIFLGIYLLLNAGMAFAFALGDHKIRSKAMHGTLAAFFLGIAVFVALSRATIVGMALGSVWFALGYRYKNNIARALAIGTIILGMGIFAALAIFPNLVPSKPFIVHQAIERIISIPKGDASRASAWTIAWQALKAKPILGYGPENFEVGFNAFYDPALPQIGKDPEQSSSWWDRGHNIVFDLGAQAGTAAIVAYFLLVGSLLWGLGRLRVRHPEFREISFGMQVTLIAYLAANFFSFDSFSSFLMTSLMFGYAMSLFVQNQNDPDISEAETKRGRYAPQTAQLPSPVKKLRLPILMGGIVVGGILVQMISVKPLRINSDVNLATYLAEHDRCEQGLGYMNRAANSGHTFLDPYIHLKYIDFVSACGGKLPARMNELLTNSYAFMKKNTQEWSSYERNWIFLAKFANGLADRMRVDPALGGDEEHIRALREEARRAIEKAHEMSPKRQEVYVEWIKIDMSEGSYQRAKERARECIGLNEKFGECWWLRGVAEISLREQDQFEQDRITASERGYNVYSIVSLSQLAGAYLATDNLPKLAETYEKLVESYPNTLQYRASLAQVYKELGQFAKARAQAAGILRLNPESKNQVQEFLNSLR